MRKQYKEILEYVFQAVIVITFFGALVMLFKYPIPKENKEILLVGTGVLFTAFATVVNYRLGSSAGSQRKTDIIAQQTPAQDDSAG